MRPASLVMSSTFVWMDMFRAHQETLNLHLSMPSLVRQALFAGAAGAEEDLFTTIHNMHCMYRCLPLWTCLVCWRRQSGYPRNVCSSCASHCLKSLFQIVTRLRQKSRPDKPSQSTYSPVLRRADPSLTHPIRRAPRPTGGGVLDTVTLTIG
jgi:hypothetical protein